MPNKFGFDNIITVFDYNKTKSIFQHFYGQEANYDGYINKFTSHQPFFYSIDEIARKYLYNFISKKCCIKEESIRSISEQVNKKLDSLSVRDVHTILNGIDLYIQEKTYKGNILEFNTKSPLTYTISILKLLGITQNDEIKSYILQLSALDLLNCINIFLCINNITERLNFKSNQFYINTTNSETSDNGVLNKIQIEEANGGYGYSITLNDKMIENCINEAFDYITKYP